jgi:hypothetical protein
VRVAVHRATRASPRLLLLLRHHSSHVSTCELDTCSPYRPPCAEYTIYLI